MRTIKTPSDEFPNCANGKWQAGVGVQHIAGEKHRHNKANPSDRIKGPPSVRLTFAGLSCNGHDTQSDIVNKSHDLIGVQLRKH